MPGKPGVDKQRLPGGGDDQGGLSALDVDEVDVERPVRRRLRHGRPAEPSPKQGRNIAASTAASSEGGRITRGQSLPALYPTMRDSPGRGGGNRRDNDGEEVIVVGGRRPDSADRSF